MKECNSVFFNDSAKPLGVCSANASHSRHPEYWPQNCICIYPISKIKFAACLITVSN